MKKTDKKISRDDKKLQRKCARKSSVLCSCLILVILAALICAYVCCLEPQKRAEEKKRREEKRAADYQIAFSSFETGNWADAYSQFAALKNYRDSKPYSDTARCLMLFESTDLDAAASAYDQLTDERKQQVLEKLEISSFAELAQAAVSAGKYEDALQYYSLDRGDPDSDSSAYTINVYLAASALADAQESEKAMETLNDPLLRPGFLDSEIKALKDRCLRPIFEEYEALLDKDCTLAMEKLLTLKGYEPADKCIRDVLSNYSGAFEEMERGNYQQAVRQFLSLNNYEDSADMAKRCAVLAAGKIASTDAQNALDILYSVDNYENYLEYLPEDSALFALLAENDTIAAEGSNDD